MAYIVDIVLNKYNVISNLSVTFLVVIAIKGLHQAGSFMLGIYPKACQLMLIK